MAVQIEGMDKLIAKLNALGGNAINALTEAIGTTILSAQGDAVAHAPVDTGALKLSIASSMERDSDSVTGVVFTNSPYAAYQEFGTSRMAAHPYMMPALNENKPVFEKQAKTELEKAIKRTAGGG